MDKPKINYLIDLFALISFCITAFSGVALKIFMPSGVKQGRLQEFLGIQKGAWLEIHDWAGILMLILVVVHFILHWDWIVCMTKNLFQTDKCEIETKDNSNK